MGATNRQVRIRVFLRQTKNWMNKLILGFSTANVSAINNLLEVATTEFQRRFHISADADNDNSHNYSNISQVKNGK